MHYIENKIHTDTGRETDTHKHMQGDKHTQTQTCICIHLLQGKHLPPWLHPVMCVLENMCLLDVFDTLQLNAVPLYFYWTGYVELK